MSLFSDYLLERKGCQVDETPEGFIIYRFDGETCIIEDIFVTPEKRGQKYAFDMAESVVVKAKEKGCNFLQSQVWTHEKGSERSLKVQLDYGFRVISADAGCIILAKKLGE